MDWATFWNWALGIVATLFGGLNIFQWITLRSYKRVKAAEADRQEIENLRLVIQTMQGEIQRLQDRLEKAEQRAEDNYGNYVELQREFELYKSKHNK